MENIIKKIEKIVLDNSSYLKDGSLGSLKKANILKLTEQIKEVLESYSEMHDKIYYRRVFLEKIYNLISDDKILQKEAFILTLRRFYFNSFEWLLYTERKDSIFYYCLLERAKRLSTYNSSDVNNFNAFSIDLDSFDSAFSALWDNKNQKKFKKIIEDNFNIELCYEYPFFDTDYLEHDYALYGMAFFNTGHDYFPYFDIWNMFNENRLEGKSFSGFEKNAMLIYLRNEMSRSTYSFASLTEECRILDKAVEKNKLEYPIQESLFYDYSFYSFVYHKKLDFFKFFPKEHINNLWFIKIIMNLSKDENDYRSGVEKIKNLGIISSEELLALYTSKENYQLDYCLNFYEDLDYIHRLDENAIILALSFFKQGVDSIFNEHSIKLADKLKINLTKNLTIFETIFGKENLENSIFNENGKIRLDRLDMLIRNDYWFFYDIATNKSIFKNIFSTK